MARNSTNDPAIFGSPEFWNQFYEANKKALDSLRNLEDAACEIFNAAGNKITQDFEKAVFILTRITLLGLNEVKTLAANGLGPGAMKIVRGMFESSILAEYLRLNPLEANDYIDFGKITAWRRYQWWQLNNASCPYSPEQVRGIEDDYNSVKSRFTNSKGKVRYEWTSKSVSEIADAVGRTKQYETVYSLSSSLGHSNYEGISMYANAFDGPSTAWVSDALMYSHSYARRALSTLNQCCNLGMGEKINALCEEFITTWKKDKN